ncbi:MAG: prepilin-type N-terminal cleavage/methylation domain-containing protein [Chthoniobacteraceae bacterium]
MKNSAGLRELPATKAFTLVELMVVIAIMVALAALAVPAFTAIKGSSDVTKAVYDISGALDQARTYAMANNTYTWVGFFEEDGSQSSTNPATAGTGRVVISIVASKDGTSYSSLLIDGAYPKPFGAGDQSNQVTLLSVGKPIKISNIHVVAANNGQSSGNTPPRPAVPNAYQVGDPSFATHNTFAQQSVSNPTTFTFPLTTAANAAQAQYTFTNIIEFNPQGEPSKIVDGVSNGPQSWLEAAIQPTHGNVIDPKYAGTLKVPGAVLIEGISGRVEIFRLQ